MTICSDRIVIVDRTDSHTLDFSTDLAEAGLSPIFSSYVSLHVSMELSFHNPSNCENSTLYSSKK